VLLVCPGPIARDDAQPRYASKSGESNIPDSAQQQGGGAKLRGIDPDRLAEQILAACQRRQAELIVPARARILCVVSQISPRLGDWILKKWTTE
jgi:short-subunit dehydrogenase